MHQPLPYGGLIQPGVAGQARQPDAVDLHDPVILGTVAVGHHQPRPTTLGALNGRQDARRQGIELCDEAHVREEGDGHTAECVPSRLAEGKRVDSGLTLLEILVVVAILGLLNGLVAPAALRQLGGARVSIAKKSIGRVSSLLDLYKLDTGTYPSTDQGIAALIQQPAGVSGWNGPYIRNAAAPLDPWNRLYVYRFPSSRTGRDLDLCSTGPAWRRAAV